MAWFSLLVLAGVLLVSLAVIAVVRSAFLPRGERRGAVCGQCDYAYSGLPRCPECGLDVAEAGVLTPRLVLRLRGGVWMAAVALLFLAAVGGATSFGVVTTIASAKGYFQRTWDYGLRPERPPPDVASNAGQDYEIQVVVEALTATAGVSEGTAVVGLSVGAGQPRAVGVISRGAPYAKIDLVSGATEVFDAADNRVASQPEFDSECAALLYRTAGLDPSHAAHAAGMDSLLQFIRAERKSPGSVASGTPWAAGGRTSGSLVSRGQSSSMRQTVPFRCFGLSGFPALTVAVALVWTTIFAVFLGWVIRRRKALLTSHAPVRPA